LHCQKEKIQKRNAIAIPQYSKKKTEKQIAKRTKQKTKIERVQKKNPHTKDNCYAFSRFAEATQTPRLETQPRKSATGQGYKTRL
jgi:hypothetical protein